MTTRQGGDIGLICGEGRGVHRTRRSVCVLVTCVALVVLGALPVACAGSGSSGPSGNSRTLVVGFSEVYEGQVPAWLAQDEGLFKKHGLDVQLQYMQSNTVVAALGSGQAQFALGGGSEVVSANAGGADLKLLGALVPVFPYRMEAPASIATLHDLAGKQVGISSPGSESDIATRLGLRRVGLDPDRHVHLTPVGSSQNRTAALKNGAIQGGLDQPPFSFQLEKSGFHSLFDMAALKIPAVNNAISVKQSYLQSHHDVAQRFVDALVEGLALIKKSREATIRVIGKHLKVTDPPVLDATYTFETSELFPALPYVRADQLQATVQALPQRNHKVAGVNLNRMLDGSFVQSAADRSMQSS